MKRLLLFLLVCVGLTAVAVGQETRATLTGRVTDPTGAVVPNATIEIVNQNTGAKTVTKSTVNGAYTAPFLIPGTYKVSVQMAGFKGYVHAGLELGAEQTVAENIVLQLGDVSESVTVTAATPLVDTTDAGTGQSLTADEVADLPNNGRSPLGLAHTEYGAVAKGKHSMSQITPFGNQTADDFSLGGGQAASNELLLNGVPNMQDFSRYAGFSPELDAVDTVHVDEFSANASMGDTNGGTVNITTKSGTNDLHGTASEYYQGSRPFEAMPYFKNTATTYSTHTNQLGATVGGPVYIPHLIHGRNKLFFFYAYEGYYGDTPVTTITSVPTADERNGDFHNLLTVDGTTAQLYDPYSATTAGVRTAIPNNCITATTSYCANAGASTDSYLTLSPIAKAYLSMVPLPNYSGSSTTADGGYNFYAFDPTANKYYSHMARVDWNVSTSDKVLFEFHRSHYFNTQGNVFNNALTGTQTHQNLLGGQIDNVKTFSPSLNLETRLGFSRNESTGGPGTLGMSPSSVGFPSYLAANATALALPVMTISDSIASPTLSAKPSGLAANGIEFNDNIQLFVMLSKAWGKHTFKVGADIRSNKLSWDSSGNADGAFTFTSNTFVTQNTTGTITKVPFGSSFALFELGIPTAGSLDIAQRYQADNWYSAGFLQDDWKALHNLTISIGARFEHETPVVESNNKMIQNWNPSLANSATSGSESNYTSQYTADQTTITKTGYNNYLPATASFNTSGGTVYASDGNRSSYNTATLYISPRIGFSYAPDYFHGTLAIRGGFGIYVNPFNDNSGYSAGNAGFTQTTTYNAKSSSYNSGGSPLSTLADPFPQSTTSTPYGCTLGASCPSNYNPIMPVLGSLEGVNANLGGTMNYLSAMKVPYSEKFDLDVQKQFGHNWMAEIGGLHVHSIHNLVTNQVYWAPLLPYMDRTSSAANSTSTLAISNGMGVKVSNPFAGTFPSFTNANGQTIANTTTLNTSSTVTVSQLLQASPQYSTLTGLDAPLATVKFDALMARLYKRMSNGLEFNFNYQWSRQIGTSYGALNNGGPLWHGESSSDFPQHVTVTAIYQLPFGRGRMLLNNANRLVDEAIGGWELSGTYQYLSGTPLSWSNTNYSGNFTGFNNHPHYTAGASFNTTGFDVTASDQPGTWNYRTFPAYLLRSDPTNNVDLAILKDFMVWERVKVQPRVDVFNAFNHAQMGSASTSYKTLGSITSQLNVNRALEGGIHILF
jgi:hypothetical protein